LNTHAAELQLGVDPNSLTLVHEADTPVRKVYRYQKTIGGIPVHNGYVIVQADHQARVRKIEVSHHAQMAVAATAAAAGTDIGAQERRAPRSTSGVPTTRRPRQ
jgi:post-segregation antitoxin (ccd killing protein)